MVSAAQHRGFVESLARLCATFWGWEDSVGGLSTIPLALEVFGGRRLSAPAERPEPTRSEPRAEVSQRPWRSLAEA